MGICDGRVVVITGAGRGIGREHALEFASQGAKVVVNDLGAEVDGSGSPDGPAGQVVDEVRAMGGEAVANGDDVSDYEGAGRLIETAIDTFGTIDVLVNNAGILRDRMLVNMTIDEWDAVIKVHLRGTFAPNVSRRGVLGATGPRPARPTDALVSLTRRPRRAFTGTWARPTTGRPRPASPPSQSSPPWSSSATA